MATSNERIAAGINARDKSRNWPTFVEPGTPSDSKQLKSLASRAAEIQSQLNGISKRMSADLEAEAARLKDTLESLNLSRQQREKQLADAVSNHRKKLLAATDTKRTELLQELRIIGDRAKAARELTDDPKKVLARKSIGSERKARIIAELQLAGPATLSVMANEAIANEDVELAAAVMAVNDHQPRERRSVDSAALATAIVGEEATAALDAIDTAIHAFDDGISLDREMRTGRRDSMATLKRGVRDLPRRSEAPDDGGQDE
ncbi:MAG: hypothetical protein RID91_13145 [Azospirillaceae bacterium]